MSFKDKFSQKAKEYLIPDHDEAILQEEYNKLVLKYFTQLKRSIGEVKRDDDYELRVSTLKNTIKIEDVKLEFIINKENNTVEVVRSKATEEIKVDTWIVKDQSLYSQKQDRISESEMIDDYLKETFKNLLDL